MAGAGALGGMFWGMLFGLIFFIPLIGAAIGAAAGALGGALNDVGIDDDFIKSARDQITEGTSALFLMTSGAVMDKIKDPLSQLDFEIIASNLSQEEEENLREYFSEEE